VDWNALRRDAKEFKIPLSRLVETLVSIGLSTVHAKSTKEEGVQLIVQNLLTPQIPEQYKQNY